MNVMKKKVLSIILVTIIVVSVIGGCNSKDKESTSTQNNSQINDADGTLDMTQDDNINLDGTMPIIKDSSKFPQMKMLVVNPPDRTKKIRDLLQVQRLEKETGVIFEWQEIPTEGSSEKINLMLASGDLPDAFWNGITNEMAVQYMNQDVFIPTEELTEKYMTRLKSVYEKRPQYKASATAPNGHTYGFPYIEEMYGLVLTPGPFLINTTWLEKVGKSMPTTVDEWVDCLRAFRDAGDLNGNGIADEKPYAVGLGSKDLFGSYNTFLQFTGAFGCASTTGGMPQDYFRIIDDKVVFTAADEAYKETANFFNMLNNEKLIDPDSFSPGTTPSDPLYLNTLKNDVAQIGSFGVWAPINQIPVREVYEQYAPLPRLFGKKGKMGHKLNFSEMQNTSMITITTECKYPEVMALFVDYLFEPEISITTNWGAVDYVYKRGDDGILHFDLDENGLMIMKDGYTTFGELRSNSTPARGAMAVLNEYYDTVADYTYDAIDLLAAQKVNGKDEILAEYTSVPRMLLTVDEQSKISQIQPQIFDIVTKYTLQWILDGNAETTWNEYLSDLEKAGLSEITQTFQGAYDRYLENVK